MPRSVASQSEKPAVNMDFISVTAFGQSVRLHMGKITPPVTDQNWYCDQQQFYLNVAGVAKYQVLSELNCIIIEKSPELSNDDFIATWLYGTVFAYLLQQHGYLVLHGSAVLLNGKAVVFSGDSGAGKSTLAAAMVAEGYPLLTDDVVALRYDQAGVPWLIPGPSRVKLWSDALAKMGKSTDGLKAVINKDRKYELPIVHHHPIPVEVSQLYELNHTNDCSEISISQQSANAKLMLLVKNTYRFEMLKPLGKLVAHFHQVSQLAARLEVYQVWRPSQHYLLKELVTAVVKNLS